MNNPRKILVYTFEEKTEQNIHYVSEESFLRPPLNYYDITIPLLEKRRLESSNLNGKTFLELFYYKDTSLWWMLDWSYFWHSFSTIIYFIDEFQKVLDEIDPEQVIVKDFKKIDVIKQICNNNDIKINYSKSNYSIFLIKFTISNFFRYVIRNYRLKKKLKNIIKTNTQLFFKNKSLINIHKKILFGISTTYRRRIYNFKTEQFENGEHLIEPIIDIIKKKHESVGFSLTHFSNYSESILKERLESDMSWLSEEVILLNKTKNHKIFLKNYSKLLSNYDFQRIFNYKNIQIWDHLKHTFIQMKFEPYFPYWLRMLDSLNILFDSQKPKVIFLPSETDAIQRCIIATAQNFGIRTIGIQHGEGTKDAEHSESNFRTKDNLNGCPYPDKMLVFGNFTKNEYIKQGYPTSKFIIFCNPNYLNLKLILSLDKNHLRKKFLLDLNKKILLFTTSRYTFKNFNYDIQVLKKLINEFKYNDEIIFLIKPHPSENLQIYENFLNSNTKNFKLIQGNILELIMLSDGVVSNTSTAIVDAITLKKPVIELKWKNWIDLFGESNIVLFSELDEMKENIQKILNDNYLNDELLSRYSKYVNDHYNLPIEENKLKTILIQLIDD